MRVHLLSLLAPAELRVDCPLFFWLKTRLSRLHALVWFVCGSRQCALCGALFHASLKASSKLRHLVAEQDG